MVDIVPEFFENVKALVTVVLYVVAVVFVLKTWWTTRALVPTLGAVLLGAIALYMASNYTFIRRAVEEEREVHRDGRTVLGDE